MQSSSFKNSTIAWRRTPSHPIIQSIENMIRRSSTPDILQTSLSIYQFKSALLRKSAPLPSHRSGVPECRLCLHLITWIYGALTIACTLGWEGPIRWEILIIYWARKNWKLPSV
jgi:hypothetical protein